MTHLKPCRFHGFTHPCYPAPHTHYPAWLRVKPYRIAFLLAFAFQDRHNATRGRAW